MNAWFSQANFSPSGGGGGGTGATQGATGPRGLVGYTGPQGPTGLQGRDGFTGALGGTGLPGAQGFTGLQGITGLPGLLGYTGLQGSTGLQGGAGATGISIPGYTGLPGITGIPGMQGVTGLSGGGTGLQGVTGLPGGGTGLQGPTGLQGVTGIPGGGTGLQGATGVGVTGPQGSQGVTGPSGGGGGSGGSTGVRGVDGDGIVMIQVALLGSASNTTGYFSVQPGSANPYGVPIDTQAGTYGNGSVNGIKIPFDYNLLEVHVSVAHCAVSTATASTTVNLNLGFHSFTGIGSTALGTVKIPLSGASCGVYNNLGGDNFQKVSLTNITGISGTAGDLVGFLFNNVPGSTTDLNAISRCTILAKVQRANWSPLGYVGTTGVQGITGLQGTAGFVGATGLPGDASNVLWAQASLLGTASNTIGLYSTQPGSGNPFGVPVSSPYTTYGNGGVNPIRLPWPYVIDEAHLTVAHVAVSTATAYPTALFNVDFYGYQGSTSYLMGSVGIPIDGTNCGVYNNLGGDNYQAVDMIGLGLTGPKNQMVGFQFRNAGGSTGVNAVSRSTLTVKFRKQGT